MKQLKVKFYVRYVGEKLRKEFTHVVEVEVDSTPEEESEQIKEYYYKEIVFPETNKISQTYPYTLL